MTKLRFVSNPHTEAIDLSMGNDSFKREEFSARNIEMERHHLLRQSKDGNHESDQTAAKRPQFGPRNIV